MDDSDANKTAVTLISLRAYDFFLKCQHIVMKREMDLNS
ncbi:Uncharacterized protein BM_BM455 [Brugia malayi]|uniref:Bm455 n=1 Tax=Brugia malayi TaxID=6279 RepID=A0A0J9XV12_BRUMA|nr:Uncharacterized protein BM_BM455 [Brugia malayi]CDP95732.1 Bm455 [Brugia malayi]VIO91120.1 Uncharacterized protein BM_BM455 [Brugia malayi]